MRNSFLGRGVNKVVIKCGYGSGKYRIISNCFLCGEDLNVSVVGGSKGHIGACAIAFLLGKNIEANLTVIDRHKEGALAEDTAKKLTSLFSCVATVSVGIHIDNAEKEEIELLVRNFEQCIKAEKDNLGRDKNEKNQNRYFSILVDGNYWISSSE